MHSREIKATSRYSRDIIGVRCMSICCATLSNGVLLPVMGFGTFCLSNSDETVELIKTALKSGYRHIDTASVYRNQEVIG